MPKNSDSELLTLAVLQALLGFTSETRFLSHAKAHLTKRLRRSAGQPGALIRLLAQSTALWEGDTWVIDSTPVECGRSRPTALRAELAGWASYGYCASHTRWFWGLRLRLVCTAAGLPVTFALANPKVDEREVARDLFEAEASLLRAGQVVLADKRYASKEFERSSAERGVTLLRPSMPREKGRPNSPYLKPLRQLIESVNPTLKLQLDRER